MANITMSIDDELLKTARKIAIEKDTSYLWLRWLVTNTFFRKT